MGSGAVYVPSLIKIGSGIQKLIGGDTHTKKIFHMNICPVSGNIYLESYSWNRAFIISAQNVLAGDYLVGAHVMSHLLTGKHYRDFLLHYLPKLLEDVPLAVRAQMWYMHDSAPGHFSRAMRDVLNIMTDG
jgi:hypothetical protein